MRRLAAFAGALAVTGVLALPAIPASAADPVGGCVGSFSLVSADPMTNPDAPQHRDRNLDGWLCFNGRAYTDNRH